MKWLATCKSLRRPTDLRNETIETISPASQALLDSQSGPHASRPFTAIPYNANTTYPSHLFRLLLLRRLRLALPLSARQCRCRRALDPFGDHRAACPRAGILRSRGVPLKRAAATICREAGPGSQLTPGWRTSTSNTCIAMTTAGSKSLPTVSTYGAEHNWPSTQLWFPPLTREGQPRRHAGTFRGAALHTARQSKERTYPELLNSRRCKLVVLAIEVGRLWSQEAANFIRFLAKSRARHVPAILQTSVEATWWHGGQQWWATQPCKLSQPHWSTKTRLTTRMSRATFPLWTKSLQKPHWHPTPRIPPSSSTLRASPLWLWTYSRPSQIQAARRLVSGNCECDTGPHPQTDSRSGKRREEKNHKNAKTPTWNLFRETCFSRVRDVDNQRAYHFMCYPPKF